MRFRQSASYALAAGYDALNRPVNVTWPNVTAQTPPCFLVHAEDDPTVPVDNSLMMRAALRQAGVPVETHLFANGGLRCFETLEVKVRHLPTHF